MSTTNITPEGKLRLLLTRDELFEAYLDALTRLDAWQVENRQLLTFVEHTNTHSKNWRRRDLLAFLTRHLHDLSDQLRTIDTLISPPHENTPSQ
jgi:hypothetical protein